MEGTWKSGACGPCTDRTACHALRNSVLIHKDLRYDCGLFLKSLSCDFEFWSLRLFNQLPTAAYSTVRWYFICASKYQSNSNKKLKIMYSYLSNNPETRKQTCSLLSNDNDCLYEL